MSVRFILGRSGTGKTRTCIDAIVADLLRGPHGPALIFLVPEQATYQAERAVLSHPRIEGFSRLHVVSFDRLQVLLAGRGSARRRLSEVGRQMIVHRILRDLDPQLRVFGSSALQPGFSRQMGQVIAELYQQAQAGEDLASLTARLAEGGQAAGTALKLEDIRRVLDAYGRAVRGRFVDPDVELNTTRQAVAKADWLCGARMWVDGFAGFTAAELLVLQELLAVVSDASVALCLDPDDLDLTEGGDPTRPFYPTEQTYALLAQGVRDLGLAVEPPVLSTEAARFRTSAPLAHVEKGFLASLRHRPWQTRHSDRAVRIWSAADARAEVEAVARQIRRLVQDQGLRYREVAVICPDLDPYEHYLRASLGDLEIPFFIDRPRSLSHHPLVVLVVSALQAVTTGFQTRDLIAACKTGLFPVDADQIDLLENYCLAFGVTGSDWTNDRPWTFDDPAGPGFDQEPIDAVRREVVRPLLGLKRQLDAISPPSARGVVEAVLGLLSHLKVEETLQTWTDQVRTASGPEGDRGEGQEAVQAHAWLEEILDEFQEVFDDQTADADHWVAVLGSALSQASLALIPPTLDQVLVGTIERSRHPDLRAVFLVGVTQRQFPTPLSQGGLLTDDDRESLRCAGLSLAGGTRDALAARRYLAYVALTRASELLVLSYPAVDEQGSPTMRSPWVDDLQKLFDDLVVEQVAPEPAELQDVLSPMDVADLVFSRCEDLEQAFGALEREGVQLPGRWVHAALDGRSEACLDADTAALLGSPLSTSATRLSTFASCPYRHFARYTLGLEPRQEFRLRPLDVGDFHHRVLDALVKATLGEDRGLAGLDESALRSQVRRIVRSVIEADPFLTQFVGRSRFNAFLIQQAASTVEACGLDVARMVRAGGFRPILSEAGFGGPDDALGPFRMDLPAGRTLSLRGKIDRIDRALLDGRAVALVVDYKTNTKRFEWVQLYHGLDLQLPVYLLAVENARAHGRIDAEAVGAFYMPIEVSPELGGLDETPETGARFARKARGLFDGSYFRLLDEGASGNDLFYSFYVNKDGEPYGYEGSRDALRPEQFAAVLRYARDKVADLAGQILSGVIAARPYRLAGRTPCTWCDYRSLCRFDETMHDYRGLDRMDKAQVLGRIGGHP